MAVNMMPTVTLDTSLVTDRAQSEYLRLQKLIIRFVKWKFSTTRRMVLSGALGVSHKRLITVSSECVVENEEKETYPALSVMSAKETTTADLGKAIQISRRAHVATRARQNMATSLDKYALGAHFDLCPLAR